MTAKEYLSQAQALARRIQAKRERRARWLAQITGTTKRPSAQPRGGSCDWTDTAAKIADLTAEIAADVAKLAELEQEIGRKIEAVADARFRELLEYRYLNRWGWHKIARTMGYSEDWVKHLHADALCEFERQHEKTLFS